MSVLAEALGMKVYFYDIRPKMALGSSIALETLEELLTTVDFVTLHVPETPQTKVICFPLFTDRLTSFTTHQR